ncbi:MAG: hypothetical protein ACUVQG_09365 [Thermogutta sp.]
MTGWTGLFPILLLIVAAAFLIWHVLAWRAAGARLAHDNPEWAFRRRQFLRRLQVSGMLLILGVLLLLGQILFPQTEHPSWAIAYWLFIALITLWMVLVALADMLAGVFFFSRLKDQTDIERIRLSALVDRIRRIKGNGEKESDDSASYGKKQH